MDEVFDNDYPQCKHDFTSSYTQNGDLAYPKVQTNLYWMSELFEVRCIVL